MILHIILDASASMKGAGKEAVQRNSARFIRQYSQNAELYFWSWQQEIIDISPVNHDEDIRFSKSHGQVDNPALIDFLNQLPEQSSILFLSDGFVFDKANLHTLSERNHLAYWVAIGPDAQPHASYLSQAQLQVVSPESLLPTLQLMLSQAETRPLVIDPQWMQASQAIVSKTTKATSQAIDDDEDEW